MFFLVPRLDCLYKKKKKKNKLKQHDELIELFDDIRKLISATIEKFLNNYSDN